VSRRGQRSQGSRFQDHRLYNGASRCTRVGSACTYRRAFLGGGAEKTCQRARENETRERESARGCGRRRRAEGEPEVMCRSPSPLPPSAAAASRIGTLRRAPYVTSLIGHSSERFNGAFSCSFSRYRGRIPQMIIGVAGNNAFGNN